MSAGEIRLDDRHWPLVVVSFHGAPSGDVFTRYLAQMDGFLRRGEKHGYLVDATEGAMLGADERAAQGKWLRTNRAPILATSVGTAVVVRYAAVRFILSAIYLVERPVAPTESFTSVEDGYRWLETVFAKHALKLPPRAALEI